MVARFFLVSQLKEKISRYLQRKIRFFPDLGREAPDIRP